MLLHSIVKAMERTVKETEEELITIGSRYQGIIDETRRAYESHSNDFVSIQNSKGFCYRYFYRHIFIRFFFVRSGDGSCSFRFSCLVNRVNECWRTVLTF